MMARWLGSWLIDWVAWIFLFSEFDCSRREKDEEERIDGEILDLVSNFIIIDYEIVQGTKEKEHRGEVRFVLKVNWRIACLN